MLENCCPIAYRINLTCPALQNFLYFNVLIILSSFKLLFKTAASGIKILKFQD